MTVWFEGNDAAAQFPFDAEALARAVIGEALKREACPYEAEVSVTLTDDEEIRALNRAHRGIDAATDVLSFPLVPFEEPCGYGILRDAPDCFSPESGELLLGDIVISTDHVAAQAAEYGHSVRREYAFLIAHSMLHLLGYDHMDAAEAGVMETHQEAVLAALSITRNGE